MSDDENKTPSKQTSSVPLKKETVRVTLKAADAPPTVPSATLPPTTPPSTSPAKAPTPPTSSGTAPKPDASMPPTASAPAVGAPTKPKSPAPAPTIKLATSRAPIGAPTIALKTANAPLSGGGAPGVALPKATVALNPETKPLTPASAAATRNAKLSTVEDEEEDETGASTFTNILAGVGLAAAVVVLGLQLKIANIWIGAEDADAPGGWSQLLE